MSWTLPLPPSARAQADALQAIEQQVQREFEFRLAIAEMLGSAVNLKLDAKTSF
jgi:hypothetical protein